MEYVEYSKNIVDYFSDLQKQGTMASILVIDDDKAVLDMVEQVLEKFGFSVEAASNGKEGLEKFKAGSFDLVITDISMPGTDGNSVAQYICNTEKHPPPIIGISGTPWRIQKDYFDTILLKPFPIETLIDNVQSLVSNTKEPVEPS